MFLELVSTWERRFTVLPICVGGGGGGLLVKRYFFYQRDPINLLPCEGVQKSNW